MNKAQQVVVIIGLVLVILTALFPPYEAELHREGDNFKVWMGYRFFFAPPSQRELYRVVVGHEASSTSSLSMYSANIVMSRVWVQDATIVIVTLGLLLLLGARRKE